MVSGAVDKNSGTKAETFFQSALILAGKKPQQTIWPIKPGGTKIPLYLVPSLVHIPGDFNRLGGLLDPDQPCYAFNLPIRKCRSDSAGLVKELAGLLADELQKFQPEGPVAIGGWSAGIVSALELAHQLRARGREVVVLLSFDSAPENTGVENAPDSIARRFKIWSHNNRSQERKDSFSVLAKEFGQKSITAIMRKIFGWEPDIVSNIIKGYGNLSPAHQNAMHKLYDGVCAYQPQRYDGETWVIESSLEYNQRLKEKWTPLVSPGKLRYDIIPGTHQSIVLWNDAPKLAALLNDGLPAYTSRRQAAPPASTPAHVR
jgi:thioesterase domain-containing protein